MYVCVYACVYFVCVYGCTRRPTCTCEEHVSVCQEKSELRPPYKHSQPGGACRRDGVPLPGEAGGLQVNYELSSVVLTSDRNTLLLGILDVDVELTRVMVPQTC